MNGWILLAIGLVSLVAVLGSVAFVAVTGWRLAKHAGRFASDIGSALEPTLRGVDAAQTLSDNLARLQTALARLNVLSNAGQEGLAPWRTVRSYLGL
jgi:hypothetical protein